MRTLLHILTKPDDALAADVVARQRTRETFCIRVVDLTQAEPDYAALLEAVFDADSIQVW